MDAAYKARVEKLLARAAADDDKRGVVEFTRRLNPDKTDAELFAEPTPASAAAAPATVKKAAARRRKTKKKGKKA